MAEAILTPDSRLLGRTLAQSGLRGTDDLSAVGLRRGCKTIGPERLYDLPLEPGDTLLLAGPWKAIRALQGGGRDLLALHLPRELDQVLPAADRAPQAVLAGVLLALGFVWHLGRRLGPLEPQPERERRDLMEHLEAGADFLWREGRAWQLSAAARGRVEGAWLRRHPPLRALGQGQRAAWIAARLGLAAVDVERALYTPPGDAQALVADGALLQRIRVGAGGEFSSADERKLTQMIQRVP
jgi:hypothetical protein